MADAERYDAISIGSGLGGLTASALAAKNGKRVLVLERHSIAGGAAHVFGRPKLLVEAGLHEMDGFDSDDIKLPLFEQLGLLDLIELTDPPEFYSVSHPTLLPEPFVMPDSYHAAIDAMVARFPAQEKAVRDWFGLLDKIRKKTRRLLLEGDDRRFWLVNGPLFPVRFWTILRHDRATVGEVLDTLFGDDEAVKLALTANSGYYTDDIAGMSLIFFAMAQGSFHRGGGHFIKGGSKSLARALSKIITDAGGRILLRREVREILISNGKATGVMHSKPDGSDRQVAEAELLFGNAAPSVLRDMLPDKEATRFWEPYAGLTPSTSLWNIYIGLDRPPSRFGMARYSNFHIPQSYRSIRDNGGYDRTMQLAPQDGQVPGYVAVNYEHVDSGFSAKNDHLIALCGLDRLSNWETLEPEDYERKKAQWLDAIVADLCARYPGMADHITQKEMATAKTIHRYMNTPNGSVYGFAQVPGQSGRHRVKAKTAVSGLFLASAYASPGGGFTGAMLSGMMAWRAASGQPIKTILGV